MTGQAGLALTSVTFFSKDHMEAPESRTAPVLSPRLYWVSFSMEVFVGPRRKDVHRPAPRSARQNLESELVALVVRHGVQGLIYDANNDDSRVEKKGPQCRYGS